MGDPVHNYLMWLSYLAIEALLSEAMSTDIEFPLKFT